MKKKLKKYINRKKRFYIQKITSDFNHLSIYIHPKVVIRHLNLVKEFKTIKGQKILNKIRDKELLTDSEIKANFRDDRDYFDTVTTMDYYNASRNLDKHIEKMSNLVDELLKDTKKLSDIEFINTFEEGYKKYRKDFVMFLKLEGDFDKDYRTALYNYHSKYVKGFGLVTSTITELTENTFLQGMEYIEKAKGYLEELLIITRLLIIHRDTWKSHYKKEFYLEEIDF